MVVGKVSEFIGSLYYLCVTLLRFKNIIQLLRPRDIRAYGEWLYLPAETLEGLLGMTAAESEADGTVTVTFPE